MSQSKFFESPTPEELDGKPFDYQIFRGLTHRVLDAMRSYTRLETEGIENIPRTGPVLVVPNHSGVLGWDALITQNEILKFAKRVPRTMSHNFWHSNEAFQYVSNRLGYVPADFKKAIKIMRRNNLLLIFPEAEAGNFKPTTEMYQLQNFNPGFVSLAVMARATIVPACIIGAEESQVNLGTIDWTEKLIGARIPLPLNLIPFPVKWKIVFMKPVRLDKYGRKEAKNIRFLVEVAENIRMRIQHRIHHELARRGILRFLVDG